MRLPRVYALVDAAVLAARGMTAVDAAEALLEGGIELMQFRFKQEGMRTAFAAAAAMADMCRTAGARFVVNDRADLALLFEAGLHIGQDDLPAAEARGLLGAQRLLGISTHNEEQLLAAAGDPVDYISIGPIFSTATKAKPDPEIGLAELKRLRRMATSRVVAIGGITRSNASGVWEAGADSVAVAADLYPEHCSAASIRARAEEWVKLAA